MVAISLEASPLAIARTPWRSRSMLAAMQLTATAGDMQVAKAERAGVFNMGGTAVANYATILERLR